MARNNASEIKVRDMKERKFKFQTFVCLCYARHIIFHSFIQQRFIKL